MTTNQLKEINNKKKEKIEALEKEWYFFLEIMDETNNPFEYAYASIRADEKLKELHKLGA